MNDQMTGLTLQEILRQPDTWAQAVDVVQGLAPRILELFSADKPDLYLFTGCGTSYYLSIAAAGFFQEITGLPARAVPASELILSGETHLPAGQHAALIAFSRSGETTETIVALRQHKTADRGPALGIVCRSSCTMDSIGDVTVALPAADDHSVVMTSSFSSMLLASVLLAAQVAGDQSLTEHLQSLPTLLRPQLEAQREFGRRVGEDAAFQQFIFLGIGPFFGLASEGMLKLKEMTQVPCETYSPLEFRHGPISIIGKETLAVLLSSDRAAEQELALLDDVRSLGARALQVGGAGSPDRSDLQFTVGDKLPEPVRALLYMPLLQTIAYYRAIMLGRDPDRPQHLTQVVTLEERDLTQTPS